MDKKSNMKQAMYEMFGVGSDVSTKPAQPVKEKPQPKTAAQPVREESGPKTAAQPVREESKPHAAAQPVKEAKTPPVPVAEKPAASFLAPGTVLEGTLRSAGDIEIAGSFKGDISTEGTVVLRSNIHGNVAARSLDLNGCRLEGDVMVKGLVFISQDSAICGNVTADELKCSGQITGDLKIKENTLFESTAKITGNVVTGTIAVVKGAIINGGIEIKPSDA